MERESKNGMQCNEFEALLSEALDQTLIGAKLASFQAHRDTCKLCQPLLTEVEQGQRWLKSLAEVEPPANLVHNILIATSGVETRRSHAATPVRATWWERFSASVLTPVLSVARQPRFAMSFGMAFFSLSVGLNVAGVKMSDIRRVDLRPSAIKHSYYETRGRVAKYYDNLRVVYEFQARVQEFKQVTQPAQPSPREKQKEHKNDTSGQPDQNQERNYSRGDSEPALASLPTEPPVVTATTYRRLV
jgi:hypothetical protein